MATHYACDKCGYQNCKCPVKPHVELDEDKWVIIGTKVFACNKLEPFRRYGVRYNQHYNSKAEALKALYGIIPELIEEAKKKYQEKKKKLQELKTDLEKLI